MKIHGNQAAAHLTNICELHVCRYIFLMYSGRDSIDITDYRIAVRKIYTKNIRAMVED